LPALGTCRGLESSTERAWYSPAMNAQSTATASRFDVRANVLIQLTVLTSVIASFIWIARGTFVASTVVFWLTVSLILYWAHRSRGDSLRQIGFRFDTAAQAVPLMGSVTMVVVLATLLIGAWMNAWHFPSIEIALSSLVHLLLFGIAQQYVLLGFYYRGFASVLGTPASALLLTAVVFSAFHIPNFFLMTVTFFAGIVGTLVYRRAPNLWVNGIAHGSISFTLYYALPIELTHGLRVGPGYYE
jgi:membrane protease YdiL (CAAX protease family)